MPKKALAETLIKEIQNHRRKGLSIGEISKKLYVSKSTTYRYTQNIDIDSEFYDVWKSKRGGSLYTKLVKEEKAKKWAQDIVKNVTQRELLFFISALYWGEGSKRDFEIINSNSNLLKVFIHGMRKVFAVPNQDIGIVIRLFNVNVKNQCTNYWTQELNLPMSSIRGYEIVNGKKDGKLPYGMCRVRIRKGGDFLKKLKALNLEIAAAVNMSP